VACGLLGGVLLGGVLLGGVLFGCVLLGCVLLAAFTVGNWLPQPVTATVMAIAQATITRFALTGTLP
jgi:hypothetical protein